ncbi:MAG: RsmF rRNA methyltransferase first C-terminal domain-containing protein [Acetatifactor sp.]|nr:RsmF rRNA methyltransferase first C-terminal domain-containing protein [Acetatifactor sp.]
MLPEVFQQRMQAQLGAEYTNFIKSLEGERHRALRLNPLKGGRGSSKARERLLALSPWQLEPVPWEEDGFYYTQEGPGRHPYHEAGVYYIQEPSAMAPVSFLGVKPGEKILDLCAAPGGKSTQIAGKMQGSGLLVSNEIHPQRARILSENVERMGIRNCLVLNETPEHLAEVFPDYFDRILVDAPCSGEGMFRKNENAGEEWSPENVEQCAARQDGILDCAVAMLRPGGRLVYSTCTFAPQEDEGSVSRLLGRCPEMELADPLQCISASANAWGFSSGRPDWLEASAPGIGKTIRLWPHRLRGEGHYLAVLHKSGGQPVGQVRSLYGTERGIPEKECREYLEFAADTLTERPEGSYLRFGDQLYLAPEDMPALKGLHVLRPGLHLGTLKKNRFEPSHALALALCPEEVRRCCFVRSGSEQEADMPEAAVYLSGQTFPYTGEKGWYLITVDGYSLGWGKLAGGVMKNHYPRGLRKM